MGRPPRHECRGFSLLLVRSAHQECTGQKTQGSRVFLSTFCHGVARIFLTILLSYAAVAFHRGPCEKLLRDIKLATSSRLFWRTSLLSLSNFSQIGCSM